MNKKQLIEALKNMPDDKEIVFFDSAYTDYSRVERVSVVGLCVAENESGAEVLVSTSFADFYSGKKEYKEFVFIGS